MKYLLISFSLLLSLQAWGQDDTVMDSVVNNINQQFLIFPQEKIYLHTDKPYYITGEKIFFRAFLLDAFSNKQDTLSRYIYVELINPADSVVERLKIRRDSTNLFYGAVPLPEDLPQGIYKIRAYTKYMYNQGESSFFSKQVQISDPQILSIQIQTDFQFAEDGKINASLHFVDTKTQEVIQPQSVTMRLNHDHSFSSKPDKDGWIRVKLDVPDKAPTRVLYVEITENKSIFRKYIPIPYPEGDFDVSFYPEGGHLIIGQSSNVAFKALNTAGIALDIKGEVIDSKGDTITQFKTFYNGMGDFFIKPLIGEHYQAVCHYNDRTLKFDLPKVQKNAFALKTTFQNKKLLVAINKPDSVSFPDLYLLIHSRGSVIYAKTWNVSKDFIAFDTSIFPSGVSHILLLTKDLQIVSERLIFLLGDDNGVAEFQKQKGIYNKREQVQAKIQLKDGENQPLKGNFSIAVTNDKEVIPDTTSSIISGILLSSELKGRIDNPEFYFQKRNKEAEKAADLLMKTQGWTRYAIPDVVQGKFTYPKIPFEKSQEISGIVKNGLLSKPAKNYKVSLVSLDREFFDTSETNENGHFVFQNFEFPDSTKYIIRAANSKDKSTRMAELYVDEDTFPKINTHWIESPALEEKMNPVLLDYVERADRQYTYENGMRIIHLPEVQITGRKSKSSVFPYPDYSYSEDEIVKYGRANLIYFLDRVPGIKVVNGHDIEGTRMGGGPPKIVIDDMPITPMEGESNEDILNKINVNDIMQMNVIEEYFAGIVYGAGTNLVIEIYTKKGNNSLPSFNIKPVMPLGYQLPVEFYSPKYDTQEKINDPKPDLRTTIYWKPNVITDDAGNASVDFYTSDNPSTYSITIEGVSDNGKLIHYQGNTLIMVR